MEGRVKVSQLCKSFGGSGLFSRWSARTPVLEEVGFTLEPGELAALVGESGSGKTTLGRCLLGLVRCDSGEINVNGVDVMKLGRGQEKAFRMTAQMVFQNPYATLNPAFRARDALVEAIRVHDPGVSRADAALEVERLAHMVQLPLDRLNEYPTSLSGGEKRRVAFARAVATKPRFVVTDEPVAGLDQPIQTQLLDLLRHIQAKQQTTMLFISHDLRLVRYLASRVIVLLRGRIVEDAPAQRFFQGPEHPYSRELLESAFDPGRLSMPQIQRRPPERGTGGCSFRHRCELRREVASDSCATRTPELVELCDGHSVACHFRRHSRGKS
jgi:oligopeptide/dipeptide ABC transporter ATP-binding protein